MTSSAELDAVFAAIVQAAEGGEPIDVLTWARRYPAWDKEIAEFCADLSHFHQFLGLPEASSPTDTTVAQRSDRSRPESPERLLGERFGDYELIEVIGGGGMGQVFRARRVGTELIVALKRLRPERAAGEELMRALAAEVNAAAGLKHPHIVPIYHFGEHRSQPFFTMELVASGSLQKALPRFHNDSVATVRLMILVARAIHFAHQRGILHRDLKPANILLDELDLPRVADFGLATKITDEGAAVDSGSLAGTVSWMAPEAVRRDPVLTTAVDVWALGVILYEMLTGKRPFNGDSFENISRQILEEDPVDPRTLSPSLDRDLAAICMRCLRKDPDKRYESAAALANDLERWQRGDMVRARHLNRAERFFRWCRRHPAILGTITFIGLMLLAVSISAVSIARQQEERLRTEVGQANQFAARHVAGTIQAQLQRHGNSVRDIADQSELRAILADRARLSAFIDDSRRTLNADSVHAPARPDTAPNIASLFVLDVNGRMLAASPVLPHVIGQDFSGRDYFRGALRKSRRSGMERIHFSRVFRSENDGLDKFAIAVAIRSSEGRPDSAGVLVATITTDASFGLTQLHDDHRKAVLLAPRDTHPVRGEPTDYGQALELLILVHPAYRHGVDPVRFPDAVPYGLERIEYNYRDPVAASSPEYEGRWLAAFAPVVGTEFVVIVQQRYDEAVEPVQGILKRALGWLFGGLALGVLVLLGISLTFRAKERVR